MFKLFHCELDYRLPSFQLPYLLHSRITDFFVLEINYHFILWRVLKFCFNQDNSIYQEYQPTLVKWGSGGLSLNQVYYSSHILNQDSISKSLCWLSAYELCLLLTYHYGTQRICNLNKLMVSLLPLNLLKLPYLSVFYRKMNIHDHVWYTIQMSLTLYTIIKNITCILLLSRLI